MIASKYVKAGTVIEVGLGVPGRYVIEGVGDGRVIIRKFVSPGKSRWWLDYQYVRENAKRVTDSQLECEAAKRVKGKR